MTGSYDIMVAYDVSFNIGDDLGLGSAGEA